MRVLRLGTRGSLLALAQSRLVCRQLMQRHPGIEVELKIIETPGDRDRRTPLTDVRSADFFSADLDRALLGDRVDFCVHSLKDLPATRPAGIRCAALPARENPRDVILWRHDVPERLKSGATLRLGSSSARRQENVRDFLAIGLPATRHPARLAFVPVRGPVDARLTRLSLRDDDPEALDGVILALAGLARLWNDFAGHDALAPLLAPPAGALRWMVLPLAHCPAAPGQGVLAIECRADDVRTHALLRVLHDPLTAGLVAAEQAALSGVAAADRPAFGATAVGHELLETVCHVRGRTRAGVVDRLYWQQPPAPRDAVAFNGVAWQRECTRHATGPLPALAGLRPGAAVFAAYWHALEHHALPPGIRLWTSGIESWRQLAARGHWVEGCGDHLGFEALRTTLQCPVLGLPPLKDWTTLTHGWAASGWHEAGIGRVISTYDIEMPRDPAAVERLRAAASRATHCYWSSARQYEALSDVLHPGAHHACGAGKTWHALDAIGLKPTPFPDGRAWQRWVDA